MAPRVILDANLPASYLLDPRQKDCAINRVVDLAFSGVYTLVAPADLLTELRRTISTKIYIRDRVDQSDLSEFFEALAVVAEEVPAISERVPRIVRDRNDDYLLAAAFLHEVDVVVTGDKDLLVLQDRVAEVRIVSPREFLDLIHG